MTWRRLVGPVLGLLAVACSLDTTVTQGGLLDGRAPDSGVIRPDADRRSDGGRLRDGGARPDAPASRDAGRLADDASRRDAGAPDGGRDRPSCDDLYGAIDGYYLCEQRDDECMFFAYLDRASCDDACDDGTIPGTCTGNEGNLGSSGPERCVPEGSGFTCDGEYTDHICICSRP